MYNQIYYYYMILYDIQILWSVIQWMNFDTLQCYYLRSIFFKKEKKNGVWNNPECTSDILWRYDARVHWCFNWCAPDKDNLRIFHENKFNVKQLFIVYMKFIVGTLLSNERINKWIKNRALLVFFYHIVPTISIVFATKHIIYKLI